MKRNSIIGGALIGVGGVLFLVVMSLMQWDFTKLSTAEPFTEKNTSFSVNEKPSGNNASASETEPPDYEEKSENYDGTIQSISLDDMNMPVIIGRSPDNKIHFNYFEREGEAYTIKSENGHISATKEITKLWNLNFSMFDLYMPSFKILLPESFTGALDISTSNASIRVEDLEFESADLQTSNGKISVIDVELKKNILAQSANASIEIKSVKAEQGINVLSSNGSVSISDVTAYEISAETSNASIKAENVELKASADCITKNGSISFNKFTGESISVKTSSASIKIENTKLRANAECITSNGSVSFDTITAKNIIAKSSSASISSKNISNLESVDFETNNGSITFDLINVSKSASFVTSNAKIQGLLAGKMSNYNITSKNSNAKNSLPESMPDGDIGLNVETANGKIDINFDNNK